MSLRVLLVASEAMPLAKTGGLGDMVSAYAIALRETGVEPTILIPAYPSALAQLPSPQRVAKLEGLPGGVGVLLSARMSESDIPVLLLQMEHYNRAGLYQDEYGREHADNAVRFAALSAAAVRVALGLPGLSIPDVVHAHDWHTGLTPLLLKLADAPVKSVFTIHNLAFQGNYALSCAAELGVPEELLSPALENHRSVEFYGQLSLMKAGIVYADRVTTVSETYSREILTPRFGNLMEGVLQSCADKLSGITNGIDLRSWNPEADPQIARAYSPDDLRGKRFCKRELQRTFGLPSDPFVPVLAMCSRLTSQKMADLAVAAIENLMQRHARLQVVILGQGEGGLEAAMVKLAHTWPDRVGVYIGYDEKRAHMLHAGADILLHGSRFEPCGLTQLYAMRYGTVPVASRVGGLADTIVDFAGPTIDAGRSAATAAIVPRNLPTGFLFEGETVSDMVAALDRALDAFVRPSVWRALQRNAMLGDYGWSRPVASYVAVYGELSGALPAKPSQRVRRVRTLSASALLVPMSESQVQKTA